MAYEPSRWSARTAGLRARLRSARMPIEPSRYVARETEGLPPVVQRFFGAVLRDGQPMIAAVRLQHEGQINTSDTRAKWSRFHSDQLVVTRRPGFDWDARIRMFSGVNIFVHDAYVQGEGILHAAVLGLVTVADRRGTPELAQGELLRFLAEAAWYPTALLPSQGVSWREDGERSACASLSDGRTTVSLQVRFDDEGLIGSVWAAARFRETGGTLVPTPWHGRFWSYEWRDGMRIPTEGEVAWELPTGPLPYWRGRMTNIAYDFAA